MRFTERSSASNVDAGRSGAQAALDFYVANRENSPDFTSLVTAAMDGRSKERRAVTRANSQVARQGLSTSAAVKAYEIDAETQKDVAAIKAPARRFAGIVGIGQALGGAAMWKKMDDKEQLEIDKLNEKLDANFALRQQLAKQGNQLPQSALDLLDASGIKLDENGNPSVIPGHFDVEKPPGMQDAPTPTPAAPVGKTPETGSSGQKVSFAPQSMSLTGDWAAAAKAVGATEGGRWGYDAMNQGGYDGGYGAINSGSYAQKLGNGRPLTDLTINEVMAKQSGWNDRSITDQQWRDRGGLWAAGNYQFIPSTLASVVKKSGIDPNSKFDAKTQDALFKFHAKDVGSFQPWWGTHGKDLERQYAHLF